MTRRWTQLALAGRGTRATDAGNCGLRANTNSLSELHRIRKYRCGLLSGNKHYAGRPLFGWKSFSASNPRMTPATPGQLRLDNGSITGSRRASEMAESGNLSV